MSTQGPCSESIDNVGVCICAAVERCLAAAAPNAALPTPPVLGDVYVTSKRGMLFLQHRWTRQLLLRPRHAASSADAANAAMACSDVFVTPAAWPRQRWVRGVVSIQSRSFEPDAPLTFTTSIDNMVSDMADEKDGDDEQVWCLSDDATQPQRQQRVHDADGNASSTTTTTAASTTATRRPSHGRRANMRVCLRAVPVLLPPYNSSSSRSARALFWYEQLLQQQQLSYYHHQQQQQQQQQHQQQQLRGMYALDNRLQPQQQLLQQGHSARATAVTCASIMRAREAVLLHDLLQTVDRLLQYMAQTSTDATHDDTTATAVVDNNNSSSSFCCTTTSNGHARGGDGEHAAESSDGSEDDEAHDAYVCSIDVPVYCARVAATDNAATRLSELAPYTDAFLRACVVHDDCNDTHRSNDAAADANNNDDNDDDDDDADVTVSPSPLRQPCHRHHGRRGRVLVHDSTCALAVLCDCLDVLTSCATTTATHARTGSDNNNSNNSNHDACRADGDRQSATTRVRTVLVALRAFLACACDEAETQLEESMCERRKSSETRDDSRNRRRDGAAAAHGDDATPVSATRRACEEQLIAALHDTGIARDVAGATVCTRTRRDDDDDNNNSNGTEHATAHGDTSTTVARRFAPASGVLVHCTRGESRSVSLVLLFFLCLLRPLLRRLHRQGVTAPAAPPPCAQASRDDSNDAGKAAGSTSTATSAAAGTTPAPASSAPVAVTAVDTSSLYNNLSVVWLLMAMRVARPSVRPHISFMAEINRLWHCLIEHDDDVDLWQTINSGGHDGGCGCLHCDACTCGDGGGRGMY